MCVVSPATSCAATICAEVDLSGPLVDHVINSPSQVAFTGEYALESVLSFIAGGDFVERIDMGCVRR